MKLLILGHARHGKDAAAEYLCDRYRLDFRSSSLFLADLVVRPVLVDRGITYDSLSACYADRVNHRALWREIISDYNADDPARLAKAILSECDCYVGMRTDREYRAALPLFDHVIWIDSSGRGVPPEPRDSMTIDYDPAVMVKIDNSGTLLDLYEGLDVWALGAGLHATQ